MISFALLVLAGLFGPWDGGDVRADPIVLRSAVLELDPGDPGQLRLGRLDYLGGLIIASEQAGFGGYSGIAVDADGAGLWAIADTGHWLRLDFQRDPAGPPAGIAAAQMLPLRDASGEAITRKVLSDAESLRHLADGRWLVSFERAHRLWFYDAPGGVATGALTVPPAVTQQPGNGGIEGVAALPDGDLLLFSEDMPAVSGEGSAVWLWRTGAWRDLAWPARDDFKPTDAVALDNGDVIVLERYFTPLVGPKARLQRIPAAALNTGGLLQPELLAEWARPLSVDNMEALDARRLPDGSLWLYVMSDDNQNPLQRTLLMVFRLAP
ncbi:MAG: esterase-like activity of phytase family protein [Ferrovibrio sp.]|uniref:esterase-like activity of phytase family protein n=1 Tax=Ferrovibrio sp. TaxID=1917215 RepID=UPI002631682B|nr:esterase-like activity of phytase family protein [Ferrovibrio sp.]MCW0232324.1 esterase-like activity of phytase family protein [Ferrovibrio sp.]